MADEIITVVCGLKACRGCLTDKYHCETTLCDCGWCFNELKRKEGK